MSERSTLTDFAIRSAKKLMVEPSATMGQGLHSAAIHDVPSVSVVHALLVGLAHHIASLRPQKLQQLSHIVRDAVLWILMRPALEFRRIAQSLSVSCHARVFIPEIVVVQDALVFTECMELRRLPLFLSLGIGVSTYDCLIVDPPPIPMGPVEAVTDWHGLAGYLVKFQIQNALKLTKRELGILRVVEEFLMLDSQIRLKFLFSVPCSPVLPGTFSSTISMPISMCSLQRTCCSKT